jgi:hypothetical protein
MKPVVALLLISVLYYAAYWTLVIKGDHHINTNWLKNLELFRPQDKPIHHGSYKYHPMSEVLWEILSILLRCYSSLFGIHFLFKSYRVQVRTELLEFIKFLDHILGPHHLGIGPVNWWPLLSRRKNIEVTTEKPAKEWTCVYSHL